MIDHIIRVKDPCKPLEFDLSRPLEIEVGCGKGKFLTARAAENPDCDFLGIERMLERVRLFDGKCRRGNIDNARVLRLEALYTFHYLLPAHHARTVYVFFPDPWPKKKHHSHRLFGPLFLNALWKRLEIGGRLEFATDHAEYFATVCECFASDPRFERVDAMPRPKRCGPSSRRCSANRACPYIPQLGVRCLRTIRLLPRSRYRQRPSLARESPADIYRGKGTR
jgi:tRNA (guanine-N(7)-)-methyltransferase